MWKQEISLERVGERQEQAQVRGGGSRKARDSAGTRAGLDVGWPDAEQLSSAWGGRWQQASAEPISSSGGWLAVGHRWVILGGNGSELQLR